jgi:hypothetical protein
MKEFNTIASFNNPKIKVLDFTRNFVFSMNVQNQQDLFTEPIEDKNIIPVSLKVSFIFPKATSIDVDVDIGVGLHMSALFIIHNPGSEEIFSEIIGCSSHYNPKWEAEFYGQVAKPLSENIGYVIINATFFNMNLINFTEDLDGRVRYQFYYIPIRY